MYGIHESFHLMVIVENVSVLNSILFTDLSIFGSFLWHLTEVSSTEEEGIYVSTPSWVGAEEF